MNMQILASLLVIGMASAGMGYGTYAYFSSSKDIDNNTFTAGTVILTTGDGKTTPFLTAANLVPGGEWVNGTLTLKNAGTITGNGVELDLRATNLRIVDGNDVAVTGAGSDFASYLVVTSLKYGDTQLLKADVTLASLVNTVYTVSDPGAAGKDLTMTVYLSKDATNAHQGLTAKVDFDFLLRQKDATKLGAA